MLPVDVSTIFLRSDLNQFVLTERNSRMQDQTISLKRFGEDLVTIQQRVDQEKLIK